MPSSGRVDLGALAPAVHEYLDVLYSGRGHRQSELAESVLAGLEELLPAAERTPPDLWTYERRASDGLRPEELVEAVFCAYLDLQQHRRARALLDGLWSIARFGGGFREVRLPSLERVLTRLEKMLEREALRQPPLRARQPTVAVSPEIAAPGPESNASALDTECPAVLTTEHIATLLNIGVVAARRKLARGDIPSRRVGRRRYVKREDFLAALEPEQPVRARRRSAR